MKNHLTITLALMMVLFATNALADRGRNGDYRHAEQGERIERHMDRAGDRIQQRFEHKAERAEDRGHYRQADRFHARGRQLNRHLDHQGHRIHARLEHRARHHVHGYYNGPKRTHVVYRAPAHTRYFQVGIYQPNVSFRWGWVD